jgi:hypothetical protein
MMHANEERGKRIEDRPRCAVSIPIFYSLSSILVLAGCTDNHKSPTTRPLTMEEKQQQLLNDPFGYKSETGKTDITGGDLTHFDKDAFKKDIDNAFNP